MLLPAFLLERAVRQQEEHPISGGWQPGEHLPHHLRQQFLGIPLPAAHHSQQRPVADTGWQVVAQPLESAFALIHDQGHQQPAEEQEVPPLGTVKMRLEAIEKIIYLVR